MILEDFIEKLNSIENKSMNKSYSLTLMKKKKKKKHVMKKIMIKQLYTLNAIKYEIKKNICVIFFLMEFSFYLYTVFATSRFLSIPSLIFITRQNKKKFSFLTAT
jgi:hypothetical protein